MPYPHSESDYTPNQPDKSPQSSPFDAPVELVKKELSWLLTDGGYRALEGIILEDYETVEDLRAAILINTNKFTVKILNHILNEIDRAVDEYRRGVALL